MLTIVLWKWKSDLSRYDYQPAYVNVMASMLARRYRTTHRVVLVTDDPAGVECETFPIWSDYADLPNLSPCAPDNQLPSCFRRLRLFDPAIQRVMGIDPGSMVLSLDLDLVLTGDPTEMFNRKVDFCAWQRVDVGGRVTYCPAVMLFQAGRLQELWGRFAPHRHRAALRAGYQGSDQGWISYALGGRYPGWREGVDGIYSFSIVRRGELPYNAIIVAFNGRKGKPWDPEVAEAHPWVREHWR